MNNPVNFDESRILILDDRLENLLWLQKLLEWAGYRNVEPIADSRKGLETYRTFQPDLVILDLLMPGMTGFDVISQIRGSMTPNDYLPILVFTNDDSPKSKNKALEIGASDFLMKPGDATEILLRVKNFLDARWMHKELQRQNQGLEARVTERTHELENSRLEALDHLAKVAEFHDDETGEHTKRVGLISAEIGMRMALPEEDVKLIRMAAPLHDIGKIGIAQAILKKPGKLEAEEFDLVKRHTMIGGDILANSRSPVLRLAREIALFHHERWDGSGYCSGLKGDQIPLAARIVAIADVFDALTHERPYKPAWPIDKALSEILSQRGKQFDPEVVDAFMDSQLAEQRFMA
jgi:putative two-component system response regulator